MEAGSAHPESEAEPARYGRAFLALLAYKVVYLLAVSAALLIWREGARADTYYSDRQVTTPEGYVTFGCHFASWDAEDYLSIASRGYEAGASRCAFYPLFPLTIRFFASVTGNNGVPAGMILANAFSLGGFFIFFILVARQFGPATGRLALILLLAFPGSLFFQFIYTESLFFLLITLLLFGLAENRFWLSWVAAFLLPLTRAVGIFCVIPLIWYVMNHPPPAWWIEWRSKLRRRSARTNEPGPGLTGWSHATTNLTRQSRYRDGWLVLAPIYGWVVYLLLMYESTGNVLEGFEAQRQFGIQSIGNIFRLGHFISLFVRPTGFHGFTGSALDRCSFILLMCSLPIIRRLDRGWLLWSICLGIVPAMSGMLVSYTRFASVVFPLFVALAVFLNKPGLVFRCLRLVTVAIFAAVQVILLWRFVNFRWAG